MIILLYRVSAACPPTTAWRTRCYCKYLKLTSSLREDHVSLGYAIPCSSSSSEEQLVQPHVLPVYQKHTVTFEKSILRRHLSQVPVKTLHVFERPYSFNSRVTCWGTRGNLSASAPEYRKHMNGRRAIERPDAGLSTFHWQGIMHQQKVSEREQVGMQLV